MVIKICRDCPLKEECTDAPIKIKNPNNTIATYICNKKALSKSKVKRRRPLGTPKNTSDREWRDLSKKLREENTICEICKINKSTEVHHWLLHRHHLSHKYDIDNLVCVCRQCHDIEKKDYNKLKEYCKIVKGFSEEKCEEMILKANTYHRRLK